MKKSLLLITLVASVITQKICAADAGASDASWNQLVLAALDGTPEKFPNLEDPSIVNSIKPGMIKGSEMSPLVAAILSKKDPKYVVEELVKKYPNIDLNLKVNGLTPLMHAIQKKAGSLVEFLLSKDVKTDTAASNKEYLGDRALHIAIKENLPSIVTLIVDSLNRSGLLNENLAAKSGPALSADGKTSTPGQTPLALAQAKGFNSVVTILENAEKTADQYEKSRTAKLIRAIFNNATREAVNEWLEAGSTNINRYLSADEHKIPNVNFPLNAFNTAVLTGNEELIALLLEKGARINEQDENGNTVLHNSVEHGSPATIAFLVAAGANPNLTNKNGETALHTAIRRYNGTDNNILPLISPLLAVSDIDLDAQDKDGDTALQIAAGLGFVKVEQAINSRKKEIVRQKPTNVAILKMIRKILDKTPPTEADLQLPAGIDPATINVIVKRLDTDLTPLVAAIGAKQAQTVELLFKMYPNLDKDLSVGGLTPLHYAVMAKSPELVKILLDKGAKSGTKSRKGDLALHLAIAAGLDDVVNELLKSKTIADDIKITNAKGKTPTALAAELATKESASFGRINAAVLAASSAGKPDDQKPKNDNEEMLTKKLIKDIFNGETKENISRQIADGRANVNRYLQPKEYEIAGVNFPLNALNTAALTENKEIVGLLLDKGAKINDQDESGNTVLHNIAKYGFPPIIPFLLEKGAQPNLTNNKGETVLHAALRRGGATDASVLALISPLLAVSDINLDAKDENGDTPLKIATALGFSKAAEAITARKPATPGDSGAGKPDDEKPKDDKPKADDGKPKEPTPADPKELQDSLSALAEKLTGLVDSLSRK